MKKITCPHLGVNDSQAKVLAVNIENGQAIDVNHKLFEVETTKTIIEINSDCRGYIYPLIIKDELISPKQPIAFISEVELTPEQVLDLSRVEEQIFTGKAKKTLDFYGLNEYAATIFNNKQLIKESDINDFLKLQESSIEPHLQELAKNINVKNSLVIIGAGHGNVALSQYIEELTDSYVAAFIDYNPMSNFSRISSKPVFSSLHIERVLGIANKYLVHLPYKNLISLKNRLELIDAEPQSFIHPQSSISNSSSLGKSVCILEGARIGPLSDLGDFVFIGPNVVVGSEVRISEGSMLLNCSSVAHNSVIGKGCLLADGSRIAGRVTLEDQVQIGLNGTVNANLNIKEKTRIKSGANIFDNQ